MKEKMKKKIREWKLHTFAITFETLLEQERKNAGHGCNGGADCANPKKRTLHPTTAQTPTEATFIYEDTSTAGYLKAIASLFKQALVRKKGVHFFLIGYRRPPASLG